MELPEIFSATLGISAPWEITGVSFEPGENRLDIKIAFLVNEAVLCPYCGSIHSSCNAVEETWVHQDFLSHVTYLHTRIPRVQCCRPVPIERPWSRPGSRFQLVS